MSDRLRHFNWLPDNSDGLAGMRAQRADSTLRIDIHQERILDGFRRKLQAESQGTEQAGSHQSDEPALRFAMIVEQLIDW